MAKKVELTQSKPNSLITDADYCTWIHDIASRYRQSQIRAAVHVNSEMLHYYWQIGCDIHNRQFENRYGKRFYVNASRDLRAELGINEGFSESTMRYATRFYELYSPLFPILQHPAEDFDLLFRIPWTHHQYIIDKVKGDPHKALFFVKKSLQNQWGRAMLLNFLSTDIYERQHEELNNFQATTKDLPKELQGYIPTCQELEYVLTQNSPSLPTILSKTTAKSQKKLLPTCNILTLSYTI